MLRNRLQGTERGLATLALVLFVTLPASAEATSYCAEQRELGWSFYCDPPKRPRPSPPQAPEMSAPPTLDPLEEVAQMRQRLDRARAAALLDPRNDDKVAEYVALQNESADRAGTFADTWRRVLWARPELDYTLQRPVGNLAKNTWLDARREAQKEAAASLGERYGVIFIYSSTCPYCQAYSPVLRQWADANGVHVLPVTVDGAVLPEWPDSQVDNGQVAQMGLAGKPVPATVLFDGETNQVVPIAFGAISADELGERVLLQTRVEVGDDY